MTCQREKKEETGGVGNVLTASVGMRSFSKARTWQAHTATWHRGMFGRVYKDKKRNAECYSVVSIGPLSSYENENKPPVG